MSVSVIDILIKAYSFDVIHYEVSGIVLFKISMDPDDMLVAYELREGPGFFKKTLFAVLETLTALTCHGKDIGLSSRAKRIREEFLDGNTLIVFVISCLIGNSESALSQNLVENILTCEYRSLG